MYFPAHSESLMADPDYIIKGDIEWGENLHWSFITSLADILWAHHILHFFPKNICLKDYQLPF